MTKQQAAETLEKRFREIGENSKPAAIAEPSIPTRAVQCDSEKIRQYWAKRMRDTRPQPQLSAAPVRKGYIL